MRSFGLPVAILFGVLVNAGCSGESNPDEILARCRGWKSMSESEKQEAGKITIDAVLVDMGEKIGEIDQSKWPPAVQIWKTCIVGRLPEMLRVRDEMCARTPPPTVGEMIVENDHLVAPCAEQLRNSFETPDPAA